jgi:hypothetical protein
MESDCTDITGKISFGFGTLVVGYLEILARFGKVRHLWSHEKDKAFALPAASLTRCFAIP